MQEPMSAFTIYSSKTKSAQKKRIKRKSAIKPKHKVNFEQRAHKQSVSSILNSDLLSNRIELNDTLQENPSNTIKKRVKTLKSTNLNVHERVSHIPSKKRTISSNIKELVQGGNYEHNDVSQNEVFAKKQCKLRNNVDNSLKHKIKSNNKCKNDSRDSEISLETSTTSTKCDTGEFISIDDFLEPFPVADTNEDFLSTPVDALLFMLFPITTTDFFQNYWEKTFLHVHRLDNKYYQHLLTSERIDKMLRENPLHFTRNIDVVTYENGERQTHNPEGRAVPATVWDYYSNGCSIRILNPQTYCLKIRTLLSVLQEYFGTMTGANVYLTPPGSQGFAPHYDDIEAFILQLEGRKHWKLYAPRTESEALPRYSSRNLSREELGKPIKQLTLEAGDMLYFPRGFIHEACTDASSHSLHITVSIYQNTAYVDLLEKLLPEALKLATERDVEFRRGLPVNYLSHLGKVNVNTPSKLRKKVIENVKNLMHKLVDQAPIDWAADQLGRKFMRNALPPVLKRHENDRSCRDDGDHLVHGIIQNRIEFSLDTMVRLVRYHCLRLVVETEDKVRIYYCTENANIYHGEEEQFLEVDSHLVPILEVLQKEYPKYISIEDLPTSDDIGKIQVISDLWEKGLIITKEPLQYFDS